MARPDLDTATDISNAPTKIQESDAPRPPITDAPTVLAATSEPSKYDSIERSAENQGSVGGLMADVSGPRYERGELLGEGGMGEVRLFHDARIGRSIARKVLRGETEGSARLRRRFLREARVQGQLEHPSIVPVYDLDTSDDGALYFTMRRVRGLTLADVIHGLGANDPAITARFSRRKLLTAFGSVCLAIQYAHTRGVLHRDLKPANIMLGPFGEVYVLDWGLAKITTVRDEDGESLNELGDITERGAIMGTVGYMAPEQLMGQPDLDARTDVYSLGAILYEILTLRPLFEPGLKLSELVVQALKGVDARPSRFGEDITPDLDAICVRATNPDAAQRFQSARELADALERHLDGDRDAQRRRELAREHLHAASSAAERALAPETTASEAQSARLDAMNLTLQALALDPAQGDARKALVKLFVEVPDRLPPEAEAEMEASERAVRREGARFGLWSYTSWLLTAPFVALVGMRSGLAVTLTALLTAFCAAYARYMVSRNATGRAQGFVLGLASFTCVASLACWLGPFVLVPPAAAINTIVFAMHVRPRDRWMPLAFGMLAVTLPFAAEWLHLFPPAYAFEGGHLVLFPRAMNLPPAATLVGLFWTSLAFTVLPAVFLGRIRDALSTAERRIFMQAWHLKRLVSE